MTLDAEGLRSAFTGFFTERGHVLVPSAGLIPHHPLAPMFTNAGMNQFLPYFVGEERAPFARATSVQRCVRVRGKHDDVELIGRTTRHGSFFEMLGNFSFGDYFKHDAIAFAWEFLTVTLGLDPSRLWVTVHLDDDDAAAIWLNEIGIPAERLQRMGEDNFWEMAETGPCGPCSEIYYDRGDVFGAPGGPAHGGEERYLEIWNLVFMQYSMQADGSLEPLPSPNIDTGAGLERILTVLEGAHSVWETTLIAPLVASAAAAVGATYGASNEDDVALRVIADHARTMSFLISDGVFPSNEGRGYVLRRIIRRAVLRAQRFAPTALVLPQVVEAVIAQMGGAYPALVRDGELLATTIAHEEEAFRRTLRQGSALIEEVLATGTTTIPGDVAFRLHDTFGFPIELTTELAHERLVDVDLEGFEMEMSAQRTRARQARRAGAGQGTELGIWREVLAEFGPTRFVGYTTLSDDARVLAVVEREAEGFASYEGERPPKESALYDIVLDETPFYAEGGGQIGDTGYLESESGRFRVLDTTTAIEGLRRHTGYFQGEPFEAGTLVTASVDATRRASIRRNHTATHLLQAALRSVLGEHVTQQGSQVAPDRLRFDFSHFSALSDEEIDEVERFVNDAVLGDEAVRASESSKPEAEARGAIAFFDEKYGDVVRVVEAGDVSIELCGGTHVSALGTIGAFRITSESSIGANTRRIFATTGAGSLAAFHDEEIALRRAAGSLRTTPEELPEALARVLEHQRQLEDELGRLRSDRLGQDASSLAARAVEGRVVARRDGLDPGELRDLAMRIRDAAGVEAVGLLGTPDGVKVALVVAVAKGDARDAKAIAGEVAKLVGGGGGGSAELATAGGRDVGAIDAALASLDHLLAVS
ncbi:MAG TPA: alanine--tRNA ligase [Acidimicrobiales bacterium]